MGKWDRITLYGLTVNWSNSDEAVAPQSENLGGPALSPVWSPLGILPGKIMKVHNCPVLGRGLRDWLRESKPAQTCQTHHPDPRAHTASDLDTTEGLDHRCPDGVRWSPEWGQTNSQGASPGQVSRSSGCRCACPPSLGKELGWEVARSGPQP